MFSVTTSDNEDVQTTGPQLHLQPGDDGGQGQGGLGEADRGRQRIQDFMLWMWRERYCKVKQRITSSSTKGSFSLFDRYSFLVGFLFSVITGPYAGAQFVAGTQETDFYVS